MVRCLLRVPPSIPSNRDPFLGFSDIVLSSCFTLSFVRCASSFFLTDSFNMAFRSAAAFSFSCCLATSCAFFSSSVLTPLETHPLFLSEDCIGYKGRVWHDDSQIVEQNIHRTYSSSEDTGARITVYSITSRSPAHQTSTRMQEWQEGRQSFASIDSHDKAKKAVASKASASVDC